MERLNIWNGLDELAFYENTIILELLERSQGEFSTSIANPHPHRGSNGRCGELKWMSNFVDDFALIAAGSGGASNVTAACLEREESPTTCLTVRVAKNEAFKPAEIQFLEHIIMTMNRVKNGEIHVKTAQADCFEAVMKHCHARVRKYILSLKNHLDLVEESRTNLTRLGAYPLYNPSTCHHESKEDIEILGEYSADTYSEYIKISHKRWTDITALVRQISSTENQQATKSLAALTYQVRQSTLFRDFLDFVYQHQQTRVGKMIQQIGKISKFYRGAVTIIQVTAKLWKDMSYICVKTLASPKRAIDMLSSRTPADLTSRLPLTSRSKLQGQTEAAKRLLRRWRHYVIHAEMQLLLFYETQPHIRLAHNYIGLSKRSCHLCATFIQFHGQFVMEGAHQQLYCLWTIPCTISFPNATQEDNFKKALSSLCNDVKAKVNSISVRGSYLFPFHMESVANFSRASLLSNGTMAGTSKSEVAELLTATQRPPNTLPEPSSGICTLRQRISQGLKARFPLTTEIPLIL